MAAYTETGADGNPASAHGRPGCPTSLKGDGNGGPHPGADSGEVVWTSGATEANNLGLLGLTRAGPPGHVLSSLIEHPCWSRWLSLGNPADRGALAHQ